MQSQSFETWRLASCCADVLT